MDHPLAAAPDAAAPAPCPPAVTAVQAAIAHHTDASGTVTPGALLPILHEIQHALGHIPVEGVPVLAQALNRSRAEIHGVITFYPHFSTTPAPRHVVEICLAESCRALGSPALAAHAEARLGCRMDDPAQDGGIALRPVYCLGLCAQSPNIMIDGQPHARVDRAGLDRMLQQLATPALLEPTS